jgi:hypothetical protein
MSERELAIGWRPSRLSGLMGRKLIHLTQV